MRLTLTCLASQYIHMPLAPFCLKKAVDEALPEVVTTICDLNINDTQEDLLHRVMATQPDVLGLSLYIWNRECAARLIRRIKALQPEIIIIAGGPEATYSVEETFRETPIDYLLRGAGEESLPALLKALMDRSDAADVPGCCFPTKQGLHIAPPAPTPAPRSDLYDEGWHAALNGRMAYVETSRGCPFHCAFCLSGHHRDLFSGHHRETALASLGDCKQSLSFVGPSPDLASGHHRDAALASLGDCVQSLSFVGPAPDLASGHHRDAALASLGDCKQSISFVGPSPDLASGHHRDAALASLGDCKQSISFVGPAPDLASGHHEAPDARQVQFMPVDEALALLIRIGNSGCPVIKLIDRTFNCHKARTLALLRGLIAAKAEGRIGDVCYHFEVAADLFDDETLDLLATAPAGLFQMEAGLQSFHAPTLDACNRRTDMARLVDRIQRILAPGNVHLHIDLIAGLPQEDFTTFGQSFDQAFELHPHQLQLGFLKFIHGSRLRTEKWGARFAPDPPYEVLSTPWITYAELRRLHDAAEAVERVHNSGRFTLAEALVLERTGMRPFDLYLLLGERMAARQGRWSLDNLTRLVYDSFLELGTETAPLRDAMILDRLATDNTGYLPPFLQGDLAAVKAAARAYRQAHPAEKHPRVAILSDGSAAVAVWTKKHPVTERGEVNRLPR